MLVRHDLGRGVLLTLDQESPGSIPGGAIIKGCSAVAGGPFDCPSRILALASAARAIPGGATQARCQIISCRASFRFWGLEALCKHSRDRRSSDLPALLLPADSLAPALRRCGH